LWDSLFTDEEREREIEEAWIEEADRRLAGYRAGDRKGALLDEVMRELREKHNSLLSPEERAIKVEWDAEIAHRIADHEAGLTK
jgi:hypothetical protein